MFCVTTAFTSSSFKITLYNFYKLFIVFWLDVKIELESLKMPKTWFWWLKFLNTFSCVIL